MKIQAMLMVTLFGLSSLVGCGSQTVSGPTASDSSAAVSNTPGSEDEADSSSTGASPASGAIASLPVLNEKIDEFSAKAKSMMPADVLQTFAEGIGEVRDSGIEESAIQVGAQAIDATLPDATGNQVTLSQLWAKGPVVIVWYRGGWCPYCNMQLAAMQQALPAIEAAGGTLVAISPETPDNSLSTSEKNELKFTVLSDAGNEVAKQYGVVFKLSEKVSPIYKNMFQIDLEKYNGDTSDELPLAATYVIDQSGVVRYAFLNADYTKRAEPAAVVEALQTL